MVRISLLLLFNHTPTELQLTDARQSLFIDNIVSLPPELFSVWSSLPPDAEKILDYLKPIRNWVEALSKPGDFILIQGDFGATYLMVQFAFERGLIPVYSTTGREALEKHAEDGTVKLIHNFRHIRFRKYGV